MFQNPFKKKVTVERLARATEHDRLQRETAEAKARAKVLLQRLDDKKRQKIAAQQAEEAQKESQ